MASHNTFRDGRLHVRATMCETCIFRPGNLMHLAAGRVQQMIEDATRSGGAIVCHCTLYPPAGQPRANAVCRGFFERHPTQALQLADRLGLVSEVDPPTLEK